jgi:hypothetical protein
VLGAVGQERIDRMHVISHQPIADRLRTAGVVACHATDGAARMGGGIDREEQSVPAECRVEMAQHEAGLDQRGPGFRINVQNAPQVLRAVDHHGPVDGLAALAGAAAARQHRHPFLPRDRQRGGDIADLLGHHNADRLDLVDRGVRRIAATIGAAEQHVAADFSPQAFSETGAHAPRLVPPRQERIGIEHAADCLLPRPRPQCTA